MSFLPCHRFKCIANGGSPIRNGSAIKKGLKSASGGDSPSGDRRILKTSLYLAPHQMGSILSNRIQWVKGQWVKRGQLVTTKGFAIVTIGKFICPIRKFGVPYPATHGRAHG